jgi:predicted extracellular nuclease
MKTLFFAIGVIAIGACGGDSGAVTSSRPPAAANDNISISTLQGVRAKSGFEGQTVTITGIVTGDFQDNDDNTQDNLGGFYVQQETPDSDPLSSEGVFVFDGVSPRIDVNSGDRVEVIGKVVEYFGETQLNTSNVRVTGRGTIQPTEVDLPTLSAATNSFGDAIADLERYEGMLLRFEQTLSVSSLRSLGAFGEVTLSQGGRLGQFTNANTPGSSAYATHRSLIGRRSITLDDGARGRNPGYIRYLTAGQTGPSIRNGDIVSGLTGNLRYARGSGGRGKETWRLMPTSDPVFSNANPRPGTPTLEGSVRIASFNVLNFFSTVDTGQANCGPRRSDNCRGADNAREQTRQRDKIVTALQLIDADIVGLMELENNARASIAALVDALNSRIGTDGYAFLDTGTIGDDAIKTGFIYKSGAVKLVGPFALLDSGVHPRFDDTRNRPALAQTFAVNPGGATLTVVVNHLKSKGSSCQASGDPNTDDGQGNCNQTRTNAAAAISDWIANDPTNSGDDDFLIIGDMNAYLAEDPIGVFEDAGLINLLKANRDAYSFVFDAQAGVLDHAIATPSLASQVSAIMEWHINADEPSLLDYNLENGRDPGLFDRDTPFRASDHDPILIGLELSN